MKAAKAYYTQNKDPYENLALEDALLRTLPEDGAALFLWQNDNCVVIGRGQNAWRECDCALLQAEGGKLARRATGGGAVYHDLGNLNFSIVVPEAEYSLPRQFGVLLSALSALGVKAALTGRNDIALSDGSKISGNAFRHTGGRALHHGTLLVSADMEKGARYLHVDPEKWKAKGVSSVRARVKNLAEVSPGLRVSDVARAALRAFQAEYGGEGIELLQPGSLPGSADTAKRLSSWDWIYGMSPAGATVLRTRFPWGGLEIAATVRKGAVDSARVYTDAMDETLSERAEAAILGCEWRGDTLSKRFCDIGLQDAAEWIAKTV